MATLKKVLARIASVEASVDDLDLFLKTLKSKGADFKLDKARGDRNGDYSRSVVLILKDDSLPLMEKDAQGYTSISQPVYDSFKKMGYEQVRRPRMGQGKAFSTIFKKGNAEFFLRAHEARDNLGDLLIVEFTQGDGADE